MHDAVLRRYREADYHDRGIVADLLARVADGVGGRPGPAILIWLRASTSIVPSVKIKLSDLGPGLLLAATGIGVGDMVSSTIAGASYGLTLVWALAAGVIVKLAITEGAARWQLTTG